MSLKHTGCVTKDFHTRCQCQASPQRLKGHQDVWGPHILDLLSLVSNIQFPVPQSSRSHQNTSCSFRSGGRESAVDEPGTPRGGHSSWKTNYAPAASPKVQVNKWI